MCACVCAKLSKSNYYDNFLNAALDGSFSYQKRPVMFPGLINVFSGARAVERRCVWKKKKKKTHTCVKMRWIQRSKWLLIDALHPLVHYLQASLIILTFPSLSTPQSCFHDRNK